ncbi:Alpha/beta hydrolase family protein [Aspergillus parasiticus SU-1]|uniref:Alpha/beta hydrolase family protein n=1 Tax=Aspergillus parasiticus (strain ATCC 56775 / NRRL 5862 / SRRC 143 / SU-1) TaxID=1403190 RepID=A0A0F0II92_ASPPU|nr:Alpha/beta hydrolase family protein [Aspergillus parasiticus SU-1]
MQANKSPSATRIAVDGASLYYKIIGTGPLLIPMPGATGTGMVYEPLAAALSSHFQVALYDRRGFGNSLLVTPGEADMTTHVRTQADDVAQLIQHLSPGKPATVFAASGSAAMAIDLLRSRPDLVQHLILHEPLILDHLPTQFKSYIKDGVVFGILKYGGSGNGSIRRELLAYVQGRRDQQRLRRHPHYARLMSQPVDEAMLFFKFELPIVLNNRFNLEDLRLYRDKLVLMKGLDISPELASNPVITLSDALGISMVFSPGGHNGFITDAEEFAKKMISALNSNKAKL